MTQREVTKGLTYRDAGVDIERGRRLVDLVKPLAASTRRPEVLGGIGAFGALFEVPAGFRNPVLVSGTDGVGTKLALATVRDSLPAADSTIGRFESPWEQIGVTTKASTEGSRIGPPAESEYAVEPLGVATMTPSAR